MYELSIIQCVVRCAVLVLVLVLKVDVLLTSLRLGFERNYIYLADGPFYCRTCRFIECLSTEIRSILTQGEQIYRCERVPLLVCLFVSAITNLTADDAMSTCWISHAPAVPACTAQDSGNCRSTLSAEYDGMETSSDI